ncbi:hypothetical protein DFQ04_0984 [Algoriphagus boseongensis]|uniref:Secreted protein (Por secretion system target) n=1 Tax=Algoriphagus boseongensis TaxID=1442587 RepID=A0A4V6PW64_9BACT|nr:hypothetical protein [Algoriphagus boseongensis]TDQ19167.1 hypothetical protein DFQ04_0984 [Algoriphagus boseongensis]
MKTLLTFALAGALSISSLAAFGADDLRANSDVKANFKKVNVLLKEGVGDAKVAIYDPNGKRLHQQKVHVEGQDVIIPYNLTELPCGEYRVEILTDEEKVEYTVATFEKPAQPIQAPLVAYGKQISPNTVNLTVIGLEEPGVEVTIKYANSNKIITSEEINQPEGFQKNYQLKGVSPEDVYFELKDSKGRVKTIFFE